MLLFTQSASMHGMIGTMIAGRVLPSLCITINWYKYLAKHYLLLDCLRKLSNWVLFLGFSQLVLVVPLLLLQDI
jgi:hypothetical protein